MRRSNSTNKRNPLTRSSVSRTVKRTLDLTKSLDGQPEHLSWEGYVFAIIIGKNQTYDMHIKFEQHIHNTNSNIVQFIKIHNSSSYNRTMHGIYGGVCQWRMSLRFSTRG